MTRRHYVNNAPQRTLASPITSGSATCTVSGTFSGWPILFPFYATLDLGQLSEEIVLVTGITGSTANISRGQDGTAAVSHASGATLDFSVGAADFDEANAHVNANTGVHGVSGSVVGTSDVQTLTNKTLTNPTVNSATVTGTVTGAGSINLSGTSTAASYTASGDGKVTGVQVTKSYANEAAATTAGANVVGASVWLTTPTTGPVGLYFWSGTEWLPVGSPGSRVQAVQTTAQASLTSGAYNIITGYTIEQNSLSGFNVATGVWTCPATGTYEVCGHVCVTVGASRVIVAVGPSTGTQLYRAEYGFPTSGPSAVTAPLLPRERNFTAGDQLALMVFVNAVVGTNTSNADNSFLRIKRVA